LVASVQSQSGCLKQTPVSHSSLERPTLLWRWRRVCRDFQCCQSSDLEGEGWYWTLQGLEQNNLLLQCLSDRRLGLLLLEFIKLITPLKFRLDSEIILTLEKFTSDWNLTDICECKAKILTHSKSKKSDQTVPTSPPI